MRKGILTGLILLLCAFCAKAQHAIPAAVPPPDKPIKLLFEKTYLHTDRDVYAQGDTLWFKAYLVNAQDNKPINSSGTLYVELISLDSAKIMDREIIRLDGGLGNGDFTLADTLKAGQYTLRAYTNWMRNFGDNLVFEKQITLLNTQAAPVAPAPKSSAKNKGKGKTALPSAATPSATPSTAATFNLPVVHFYPEGGSLVEGISSLVAVKAEDGYGSGVPVNGAVLSSAGDTVARFTCDSLGMGQFVMLPVNGQSYHAVVNLTDGVPKQGRHDGMVFELPAALSNGLTLRVRQTDSVILVVVNTNDTASAINPGSLVAVKHAGKTLLSQSLQLLHLQTVVKIGTDILPEGISAITIYDNRGKPECERLVYIHHPDNKNTVSITTDKKIYQPKEKVNVQINTQPGANLSIAVVDAGIVPEQAGDIVSYLQLQSEVKGNIEHARHYFDTTNVNRFKQLDLLLMTQGWRDFIWRRLADTAIRISYAAENGVPLSGRVRDENRNKWLPGLNISLFATGARGNKMFPARSDSLGRFNVDGIVMYGKQPIKLSAANDKGENKGALTVDTLLPMPVKPQIKRGIIKTIGDSVIAAIVKKQTTARSAKVGKITKLNEVKISDKKSKGILLRDGSAYMPWGTDQTLTITPKDYEFKTLTWYLLNNAQGAKASQSVDTPGVGFIADGKMKYPILFINGIEPYSVDRNLYFNMPIDKFKSVTVKEVAEQAFGLPLKYLLYLNLKDNYLIDNPGFLDAIVQGYYQARTFYQPPPGAKPSLADYRSTIHWEPHIKADATGRATVSFYNAVPQTDVRIILQGVTNTGVPLVAITGYEVKER